MRQTTKKYIFIPLFLLCSSYIHCMENFDNDINFGYNDIIEYFNTNYNNTINIKDTSDIQELCVKSHTNSELFKNSIILENNIHLLDTNENSFKNDFIPDINNKPSIENTDDATVESDDSFIEIFSQKTGSCKECNEKYYNKTVHHLFYCPKKARTPKNFLTTTFNIENNEKIFFCNGCNDKIRPNENHRHLYRCTKIPIIYLRYCKYCENLFFSYDDFFTHICKKNSAKRHKISHCPVENCNIKGTSSQISNHYQKKHTEKELCLALRSKSWHQSRHEYKQDQINEKLTHTIFINNKD